MAIDKPTNKIAIEIAVMSNRLGTIESDVRDIKSKLEADYVTQDQFEPVKRIVYGMVSVILLAVVGALVTLILNK